MDISARVKAMGLKAAYKYIERDPDENIPKLLDWLEKIDKKGSIAPQVKAVKSVINDPDNNWSRLLKSVWTEIDANQRKKLFDSLVINGSMLGNEVQRKYKEKYDCNIPWAILMDPTSACNLECTGCWASEYGQKMNLSFEELDDIIRQGKEHGTYFYLYSGGEPLVRKKDIIRLCEKHDDCAFVAFTNGTLIDDEFADEMLRVGNFVPAIRLKVLKKPLILAAERVLIRR